MVESRYFSGFLAAGAKAERRLVEALTTGARHSGSSEITAGSTVTAVADEWYAGVERRDLAINTLAAYEETLRLHVRPSLLAPNPRRARRCGGALHRQGRGQDRQERRATVQDRAERDHGPGRIHEAIDHPVRDTSAIAVDSQDAEALTLVQVRNTQIRTVSGRMCPTGVGERLSSHPGGASSPDGDRRCFTGATGSAVIIRCRACDHCQRPRGARRRGRPEDDLTEKCG